MQFKFNRSDLSSHLSGSRSDRDEHPVAYAEGEKISEYLRAFLALFESSAFPSGDEELTPFTDEEIGEICELTGLDQERVMKRDSGYIEEIIRDYPILNIIEPILTSQDLSLGASPSFTSFPSVADLIDGLIIIRRRFISLLEDSLDERASVSIAKKRRLNALSFVLQAEFRNTPDEEFRPARDDTVGDIQPESAEFRYRRAEKDLEPWRFREALAEPDSLEKFFRAFPKAIKRFEAFVAGFDQSEENLQEYENGAVEMTDEDLMTEAEYLLYRLHLT